MIAVDTNVLIYACDQADPRRQKVALDLITNAEDGVLLWQVACEFLSASRKLGKQGFTSTHAWNRLGEFRDLLPLVLPSDGNLARAKELHLTRGASLWDALILAACVEAGDYPGAEQAFRARISSPGAGCGRPAQYFHHPHPQRVGIS